MAELTYAEIEDAVLALLDPMKDEVGIRTIEPYGGEFSPDSIMEAAINFPAILVFINQLTSQDANRLDLRELYISIYVADRNARGRDEAMSGDALKEGVYALVEAARAKLNRAGIAGAGTLKLRFEKNVLYSKALGLCVCQCEYALKLKQGY